MSYYTTSKNKNNKKPEILKFILDRGKVSKADIAKELNLSMPTVLSNTKDLMEQGIIKEIGEYESTGGRRAKSLAIQGELAYSLGLDITANHISIVLMNLNGSIIKSIRKRKVFYNTIEYFEQVVQEVKDFYLSEQIVSDKIRGVGISLPGIVDNEERMLLKSHALRLENVSLKLIEQLMPYPIYFENDANSAMFAEGRFLKKEALYFSLSNTVGGAFMVGNKIFSGDKRKAGEFGHMILVPDGKQCYCGKKGCVDAYCSPLVFTQATGLSLEQFMEAVEKKDKNVLPVWEEYLEYLAIAVTNLRMAYDTDIILGGYVGAYLEPHILSLGKKTMKYNLFDSDTSYLKACRYKHEGAAAGAAMYFINDYIENIV